MSKDDELVLVLHRDVFRKVGIDVDDPEYACTGPDEAKALLSKLEEDGAFLARRHAESSETHKQIIPYILIRNDGKFLLYQRGKGGGEERLLEQWSLGFGGHINPVDGAGGIDRYLTGACRELMEEVGLACTEVAMLESIIGTVNDEESDVGSVHFGIVHVLDVTDDAAALLLTQGEEIIQYRKWVSPDELKTIWGLETWSACVASELKLFL